MFAINIVHIQLSEIKAFVFNNVTILIIKMMIEYVLINVQINIYMLKNFNQMFVQIAANKHNINLNMTMNAIMKYVITYIK